MAGTSTARSPWLFSRHTDLFAFGGSALLSLVLLAGAAATGALHGVAPVWIWLLLVVGVDVAHVWATLFRTYLDPVELRRHPVRYAAVPAGCYVAGVALHAVSAHAFWRVLAYVALYHFIRQQLGFLSLYERRRAAPSSVDRRLERTTLAVAMLFPVLHWHAQLPTPFAWFLAGDFVAGVVPRTAVAILTPGYWSLLCVYGGRQAWLFHTGRGNPAKLLLVLTTWLCWHVGIVTVGSDFAFTVTNVVIHGVPYAVLVYRHTHAGVLPAEPRAPAEPQALAHRILRHGVPAFAVVCLGLALLEELGWDRWVWHQHDTLFGQGPVVGPATLAWLVPLLALPQSTHYVLDGMIWKARAEPGLRRAIERRFLPDAAR